MAVNVSELLGTINSMLTVVKNVAQLPGVNMIPYASTIGGAIELLQLAVQAGQDITPYIMAIKGTFGDGSKVPTEAELAELDVKIAQLRTELHADLPPAEEGEPD